jgi:hypothetical protein
MAIGGSALLNPARARAQRPTPSRVSGLPALGRADSASAPAFIGSADDARARLAGLTAEGQDRAGMLRAASDAVAAGRPTGLRARIVLPSVRVLHNSDVAYTENEGNLWAGRGANVRARAGAVFVHRRFALVLAPEVTYSQNLPFDVPPSGVPWRSPYSSPFHRSGPYGGAEMDLPLRFGDRGFSQLSPGQSALVVHAGPVDLGFATENEVWGTGRFTSLLWSAAAPSVPRLFVRTPGPLRTRIGRVDARLISGVLTKSRFFDNERSTTFRSIAGAAATLAPRGTRGLELGLGRFVVRSHQDLASAYGSVSGVLGYWEPAPRVDTAASLIGDVGDTRTRADQLLLVTARQRFPAAGVEVYGEWTRQYIPRTFREFLLAPHESQAYLVGLQWLSAPTDARTLAVPAGTRARLGFEANNLAQSTVFPGRVARDYYTGSATRLGLTQRGRVLGAFTGPGSTGQWVDGGLVAPTWDAALVLARIRWEDDALYRQEANNFLRHDVSLLAGVRGTYRHRAGDVRADLTYQARSNFLFQNGRNNPGGRRTVDVHNVTAGFEVTPR